MFISDSVVKDDAKRESLAGMESADAVSHVCGKGASA